MLYKALKLSRYQRSTKIRKIRKKLSSVILAPTRKLQIVPEISYSGRISIFVITSSQVTILLFLLISYELLLTLFNPFHLPHQPSHLLCAQSLDIDDHCVPDSDFLEKLYLLLCLEFLYFFRQLCQILKFKA